MKRLFLIVALCLMATWVSASEYRMGGRPERQFWVVSSDAPANARRGGPNVWLCDRVADNIQIQAAIDAGEALGASGVYNVDVVLIGGRFEIDAPIYVGYGGTASPGTTFGVSLRSAGSVSLQNNGGDADDEGHFMLYFCPKDGGAGKKSIVGPMEFVCTNMAGGIYAKGMHNSRIQDVTTAYGSVCLMVLCAEFGMRMPGLLAWKISELPMGQAWGLDLQTLTVPTQAG